MTADDFERERELFLAAAELPPSEREAFLAATVKDAPELREKVRRLLEEDEAAPPGCFAGGTPAAPAPGARLGPYRIVREIGRGGQGVVYLAEDERLGRRVALKALTGLSAADPQARARFAHEARGAARLEHPAAVRVFDVGEADGVPYLVMRFVDGPSAAACVAAARRGEPSPLFPEGRAPRSADEVRRTVAAAERVARALEAAHVAGVLHRDVKPANVLVDASGEVFLADFGLAVDADAAGATRTGDLVGTAAYMAPERLSGRAARATPAADVFSLGATLYELLTLRRAFAAATPEAVLRAVLDADPPPPRRLSPAVSRDLETVVLTAIEKSPARRYATAGAFADDLSAVLRGDPPAARRPGLVVRAYSKARRRPAVAALVVALAAVAAAAAALAVRHVLDAPRVAAERARERADSVDRLTAEARFEIFGGDLDAAVAKARAALALDPAAAEALAVLTDALATDRAAVVAVLREYPQACAGSQLLAAHLADAAAGRPTVVPVFEAVPAADWTAVDDALAAAVALTASRTTHDGRAVRDAVRFARRAVTSVPAAPFSRVLLLAETAAAADDRAAAADAAATLLRRWPTSHDARAAAALALAAESAATSGKEAAARGLLDTVRGDACSPALAYRVAARSYVLRPSEDALAAMGRAADRSPPTSRVVGAFAMVLGEVGDPEDAERRLRPLLDDPRRAAYAVVGLASALRRQDRAADALPLLDAALRRAPAEPKYLRERARLLIALERFDEAVRDLQPLRASGADDADFRALWRSASDEDG